MAALEALARACRFRSVADFALHLGANAAAATGGTRASVSGAAAQAGLTPEAWLVDVVTAALQTPEAKAREANRRAALAWVMGMRVG